MDQLHNLKKNFMGQLKLSHTVSLINRCPDVGITEKGLPFCLSSCALRLNSGFALSNFHLMTFTGRTG